MAALDDTIILGEAKGSVSGAEVAAGFEDLASIDERRVRVGCRRARGVREARRGAHPRRGVTKTSFLKKVSPETRKK